MLQVHDTFDEGDSFSSQGRGASNSGFGVGLREGLLNLPHDHGRRSLEKARTLSPGTNNDGMGESLTGFFGSPGMFEGKERSHGSG